MNKPLHERLAALHDFLSPPCTNALSTPGLDLLEEAVKALTPPTTMGQIAPTAVEMPWPNLPAGSRLVTSAYPRSVVADYGNARAVERDTFWRGEIARATPTPTAPQEADALREADTPWQLIEMARRVSAAYRDGTLTGHEIHYLDTMIERAEKMPTAARDVLAERRRQVGAEGWTPTHDDEHGDGSMAQAAACYALHTEPVGNVGDYLRFWPWASEWWKPKDRRRNLVRAAALILAEIERLDRAALAQHQPATLGETK